MSAAVPKVPKMSATLADLLALPEGGHGYEIVNGELVEKQTSGEHSRAQAAAMGILFQPFSRHPGGRGPGGWWFGTEALIDFGEGRYFRSDVVGWRREKVAAPPTGTVATVIPDWICEIISPSNASHDTVTKMAAYYKAQVPHYWLIDPRDQTLAVYRWTQDGYLHVLGAKRGDRVKAEPFAAIELQVGMLFGDDEDER